MMTNYNERPDDLTRFMKSIDWEFDENGYTFEDNYINFRAAEMLRQAITSLTKELVAEAKPEKKSTEDYGSWEEGHRNAGWNNCLEHYEANLLKALEEV